MRHPLFQDPRSLALLIQDQERVPHHPSGAQPLLPDQHQRMAGRVSSSSSCIHWSFHFVFRKLFIIQARILHRSFCVCVFTSIAFPTRKYTGKGQNYMQEVLKLNLNLNLLPKQVDCFFGDARNSFRWQEMRMFWVKWHNALLTTKSALVIKKKCPRLSQSAFSNFVPYMIRSEIMHMQAVRVRFEIRSMISDQNCWNCMT